MTFQEKLGAFGGMISGKSDPAQQSADDPADWGYAARRDLLEQITDFLLRHDLAVNPANLGTAHAILSGADLSLARKVAERETAGDAITQDWLDDIKARPGNPDDERKSLERMMDQFEATIAGFARTTATAQSETGAMQDEMQRQVDAASNCFADNSAEQIMRLSTVMLGTLQRIEENMAKSQDESRLLQAQLDKARQEAHHDHLTGLPNRRAFEQTLLRFHGEAADSNEPMHLAICDVDHFKRINDTFGHETGDRLLRAIAGVLQRFASTDCFVARHGGEEFVILIKGASADEAFERLETARRELAERKFVARRNKRSIGQVTFSAGIADVFATDNPRDALAAADAALYRAKEEGRNRVLKA